MEESDTNKDVDINNSSEDDTSTEDEQEVDVFMKFKCLPEEYDEDSKHKISNLLYVLEIKNILKIFLDMVNAFQY
jgi:hypothetical protein